jgi:DNA-binding NtrC family response regulator
MHILIIEDINLPSTHLGKKLVLTGHVAAITENGSSVLQSLPNHVFDLSMMNLLFPCNSNFDKLHTIKTILNDRIIN